MNIADALRQQTLPTRDRLAGLDQQIAQTEAVRNAAEARVKRAGTEITRQHTLEAERKRALGLAAEKVSEAQRILDELERKRQDALDVLMRLQDEHKSVEYSRREAQGATEAAEAEIRKEQKARQDAESGLVRLRTDRAEADDAFRRALLKGLEVHLEQQVATVQMAFSTQEQRSKAMREFETFKKARHTDAEIGRLCDERDEIRKLLSDAMVPGVKAMLQASLKGIEEALATRFPVALQMPDVAPRDNQIEELLFYLDREGKAVLLLPVSPADWTAVDEGTLTDRTSNSMCLVWNMIRGLGLRTEDGDFRTINGRPVFASRFDLETIASHGFSVKCEAAEVMRYVFAAVPRELQESLSHEDQNN